MRLRDKTAIVVGAGQGPGTGIGNGRATVIRFAQEGARVLAVDRDLASAQETCAMAKDAASRCAAYQADVTIEAAMKELIANGSVSLGTIADVEFNDEEVTNPAAAQRLGIRSASVVVVYDLLGQSAAARAGLRRGDIVLSINGQAIATTGDLQRMLADTPPGSTASVEILRGSQRTKIGVPIVSTAGRKR